MDYHKTMKAYAESKARLFKDFELQKAVVCIDDSFGRTLSEYLGDTALTYGSKGDLSWTASPSSSGFIIKWSTPWGVFESELPFICDFSISNLGAAIGVILVLGGSLERLSDEMKYLGQIPGRMEVVFDESDSPSNVVVDFAHTPDAVRSVLENARTRTSGRLITVIGCGGDRDKGKRKEIGKIASNLSDLVWVTSDNPRGEDPMEIIQQILSGVTRNNYVVSVDRKQAISNAIMDAQNEDIVMLLGKGDESTQEVNGRFLPFSDRDIAKEVIRGLV